MISSWVSANLKFSNSSGALIPGNDFRYRHLIKLGITFICAFALHVGATFSSTQAQPLELSPEERDWIAAHPTIKVHNETNWPPFNFALDGKPRGYSIDFMNLLAKKIGIQVEYVTGPTWDEFLSMMRSRKLDVMLNIVKTPDRQKYLLYTPPYANNPNTILSRRDQPIKSFDALSDKTIAVPKGFFYEEILKRDFPEIDVLATGSTLESMKAVSFGKADAAFGEFAVFDHLIKEHLMTGLVVAGEVELGDPEFSLLNIATRKDLPVLASVLTKAILSVSRTEKQLILERWLPYAAQVSSGGATQVETSDDQRMWLFIGLSLTILVGLIAIGRFIDRPITAEELNQASAAHKFLLAITFSNLKIGSKILILLVLIAASSIGIFGYLDYRTTTDTLRSESFKKLTAVREMKAQQIEDYFNTITHQMITFSENRSVVEAVINLSQAFQNQNDGGSPRIGNTDQITAVGTEASTLEGYYSTEFLSRLRPNLADDAHASIGQFLPEPELVRYFQSQFIAENPYPTGQKHRLDSSGTGGAYDVHHQQFHPVSRSYLERFGYYDIFLVEPVNGHIIYSVFKEVDFATSLLSGPYKDTNFAEVFRKARNAKDKDSVFLADFEPYAPSYNAPASFIGSPIFDRDELVGVAIFQMPISRINSIMTSQGRWKEVGLGDSGETYIIGDDFLMRNQSRFLLEDRKNYLKMIRRVGIKEKTVQLIETFGSTIGLQKVRTKGTVAALSGKSNTEIFSDYRGVRVLSSYRPLKLAGLKWVIMSDIDMAEAFEPIYAMQNRTMILGFVLLVIVIGVSYLFSKTMTRPIKVLTSKAEALASGDLGVKIDISGGDEITYLAHSFDQMRNALRELIGDLESRVEQRTRDLQASEERTRSIIENAADGIIVINVAGVIQSFSPAAEKIFGYSAEEVIGKKINGLMPAPYHSEHDDYLKRYIETGEKRVVGQNREVVGLRKDGTEFPMDLAVGDAVVGNERIFTGIVRDITDRKEAEQTMHEVFQIIDQMPMNVFVRDVGGRFTHINPAYEKFYRLKKEDVIGKTVDEVLPKHEAAFTLHDRDVLETGKLETVEETNETSDGEKVIFEVIKFPIADLEGNTVAVAGLDVDITDRKNLERELSIANKRMGDELNIGREIQMSMIPLTFPRFPEHKDIDVWAYLRPAREVGGDFYDFFFINEQIFAFVVADVSGKGVPAALLMAVAKTLLKSHSQETRSTARVVELTNNELSENNKDCMFITAFFGMIDTSTGEMTYTNAGHNPPYLMKPDGTINTLDSIHGPMIGAMEGVPYEEASMKLGVDDKLMLFTDGITEAFDVNRQAYGEERLAELLGRSGKLGTKYLVDALVKDVDEFVGETEQSDDITVFCLRNVAWEWREERAQIELHLKNEMAEIQRCLQALEEFCGRFNLPAEVQQGVSVVLDDLLNNVISYAFEDEDEHLIEVSLTTDKERLIVMVSDDGMEFDPFLRPDPDIESGIDERKIGGLGIHLLKNIMDDFSHRRIDGRNVTILMKRMGD